MKELATALKGFIKASDLKKALNLISDRVKHDDILKNAILLSARYHHLKNNIVNGTVSWETSTIERNRISSALMSIADDIDELIVETNPQEKITSANIGAYISNQNNRKLKIISSFNQQYDITKIFIQPSILNERGLSIPLSDVFNLGNRVLLHSESFTGKSTILKYIALTGDRKFIYLFIPLGGYNGGDIVNFILTQYNLSSNHIADLFKNENVIILFDAFDEISQNLRQNFLTEVDKKIFCKFVLTSRTKPLAEFRLPVTDKLKVCDYQEEEIYCLSDKMLNDFESVLSFYNTLLASIKSDKHNFILKYPWLVIFLLEYFNDNALDDEMIDNLPFEILNGLKKRLKSNGFNDEQIDLFYINIGEVLYQEFRATDEAVRTFHDDSIQNKPIIDAMVSLGILNSEGILGNNQKKYYISIPLINQVLVAIYIASLDAHSVKKELSKIYFKSFFKPIIGMAAALQFQARKNIDFFFDSERYNIENKSYIGKYEHIIKLDIIKHLPPAAFRINAISNFLTQYFDFLKAKINERATDDYFDSIESETAKEYLMRMVEEAQEKLFISYLPSMLKKDKKKTETFAHYLIEEKGIFLLSDTEVDIEHLEPLEDVKRYLINTQVFENYISKLIKTKKYREDCTFITSMLNSPYSKRLIYDKLWNELRPAIAQSRISALRLNQLRDDYVYSNLKIYDDDLIISVLPLLIVKGHLNKSEIFDALDLLCFVRLELDEFESGLGDFKSVLLSDVIIEYVWDRHSKGRKLLYMFNVFQIFSYNILLDSNSRKTKENLVNIINMIIKNTHRFKNTEQLSEWSSLGESIYLFLNILKMQKLGSIVPYVEQLFEVYWDIVINAKKVRKNIDDENIYIILYYLINCGSEKIFDFFASEDREYIIKFLVDGYKYLDNQFCAHNFKINQVYIDKLEKIITDNYNGRFMERVFRVLTKMKYNNSEESDTTNDSFEINTDSYYSLVEASKNREFYDKFLINQIHPKYLPMAVLYGIYHQTAISAEQVYRYNQKEIKYNIS